MAAAQGNLFSRGDTLLGVCQGLAEDLGFNPLWLRLALAGVLFWNPVVAVTGYLAMGLVVLATRLAFPDRRAGGAAEAGVAVVAGNDDGVEGMLQAA